MSSLKGKTLFISGASRGIGRMRVERIIELIAAALPELEMRAVAPPAEVWAKVDPFEQAIRIRGAAMTRSSQRARCDGNWISCPWWTR